MIEQHNCLRSADPTERRVTSVGISCKVEQHHDSLCLGKEQSKQMHAHDNTVTVSPQHGTKVERNCTCLSLDFCTPRTGWPLQDLVLLSSVDASLAVYADTKLQDAVFSTLHLSVRAVWLFTAMLGL